MRFNDIADLPFLPLSLSISSPTGCGVLGFPLHDFPFVPMQSVTDRRKPVPRRALDASLGHGVPREPYTDFVPCPEEALGPTVSCELRHWRASRGVDDCSVVSCPVADLNGEVDVVRENQRAERERVWADGSEKEGRDGRVNHGTPRGERVGRRA